MMKIKKMSSSEDSGKRILLACVLITFVIISRVFMPYPPNFAPIAAIAIFAGAVLPRKWGIGLPLAAIIISDLFIGLHSTILFTWGSFVLIALLSSKYLKKIKPATVTGASLGASVLFFIVTNFGVWLEGRLYTLNWSGLVQCYYNALPFFRNTLLGDMTFTVVIFSAYALAYKFVLPKLGTTEVRSI